MNLIDRPHFDHDASDHRGLSAAASAALHAAAVLTLIVAMRMASQGPPRDEASPSFVPQHVIFIPHDQAGDGRDQGGERSIEKPRRAQAIGTDPISVPTTVPQQPSTDSTIEPPEEASTIPVKPFGDATQTLVGVINGVGVSSGPGETGVGPSPGRDTPGFGPGAIPGSGPGVTLPIPVVRASPKYTVEAMQARIQGLVMIECVVLPDGTVGDARVTRSLDRRFGLDEEAIAAAKRWRFRPGLLNGKPVPVIVTIELTFNVR